MSWRFLWKTKRVEVEVALDHYPHPYFLAKTKDNVRAMVP